MSSAASSGSAGPPGASAAGSGSPLAGRAGGLRYADSSAEAGAREVAPGSARSLQPGRFSPFQPFPFLSVFLYGTNPGP